jgi:hypothetical protein
MPIIGRLGKRLRQIVFFFFPTRLEATGEGKGQKILFALLPFAASKKMKD